MKIKNFIEDSNNLEKKEKTVPIELNLSIPAIWYPQEKKKFFEIRSFENEWTDGQGKGCSAKVQIKPDYLLGTLNTADQRVLYCLLDLWEEQGRPSKIFFSIRQILRMLNVQMGKNTYAKVENSLLRLTGVGFNWNGGFYDFLEKKHINIKKAFSIINDLQIITKEEKSINSEESYVVLNENIIKNLLGNGCLPVNRSIFQSFKSPIAQLLYTHIDKQLYGTNKYSRITRGLIQDLGLSAKRYIYLSNRKELFLACREEILGVETGYGEIINHFELYEGKGNDKDWIVEVRRTGEAKQSQKANLQSKELKLLPETQNNVRREIIEVEPIQEEDQDKKHCREQNNTDLGHIPTTLKPKPQKVDKISDIDSFIKLFAKSFPNAKPAEKVSLKVKQKVQAFLKIYPLEKAEAFLKFCLKLGQEEKYNAILLAQTANYLIDYKIGDQLLVDAWLQKDVKPQNYNTLQEQNLAEGNFQKTEDNYHIWLDFKAKYKDEYNNYLIKLIDSLSDVHKAKFEKYKQSYFLPINTKSDLVTCFYYFCGSNGLKKTAPCFVEWAYQFKTDEYKKVRYFRDTSQEARSIARLGWE